MRRAVASAPGKVILFGEHFVVRGAPSIVSSICRRVYVEVRPGGSAFRVESPRLGISEDMRPEEALDAGGRLAPLAGVLRWFRERYGVLPGPAAVRVRSELPVGAGLGSSAAFAAAFSLAYAWSHGIGLGLEELEEAALEAEKIAHGRPSGIDTAIAVRGGSLLYRRGERPRRLRLSLPGGVDLIVADSGVGRSTREVVEDVLRRADLVPGVSGLIYEAASRIVEEALGAFERGDAGLLGELMDLNHGLLNAMGASSEVLERLVFAARRAEALGAKLTGAGRGGSVIVLSRARVTRGVVEALRGAGAREVFVAGLGCEGARLEA